MSHGLTKFNVAIDFVDTSDPENVRRAMKPNTKVVYLESPANPNMVLSDISEISKIAHENPDCKVVVDNTYCTLTYKDLLTWVQTLWFIRQQSI